MLIRNVSRRLERLEARAEAAATATNREPHTFVFVDVNKRVTGTLTWENGESVWPHFDTPRELADFEPMV